MDKTTDTMRETTQEAIFEPLEPVKDEGGISTHQRDKKRSKGKNERYYTLKYIKAKGCHYNIIYGERSNGKSFSILEEGLKNYLETGSQMGYIRRWGEDIKPANISKVWDGLICDGKGVNRIEKESKGKWNTVKYKSGCWYLAKEEEGKDIILSITPIAYAFALNNMEHYKSLQYPNINIVFFEEFITRGAYLVDEFVVFMNMLSTIIRDRNNVIVYMAGNTVNPYCPYFKEMGLKHTKDMNKGDIDVYSYGNSGLKVAVEYSDGPNDGKPSDVYFAFDNPKLQMITGGMWELDIYPHLPEKYEKKDIALSYFIAFDGEIVQADIVIKENLTFTYIHRKSTEIRKPDEDIVYSLQPDPRPNWKRRITNCTNKLENKIYHYFLIDKVFYQDNETGEIVRNYLICCNSRK